MALKINKRDLLSISIATFIFISPVAMAQDKGKELFESKCKLCHGLDRPASKKKTNQEWNETVSRMKNKHKAPITDEEVALIVEYLSKTYGK